MNPTLTINSEQWSFILQCRVNKKKRGEICTEDRNGRLAIHPAGVIRTVFMMTFSKHRLKIFLTLTGLVCTSSVWQPLLMTSILVVSVFPLSSSPSHRQFIIIIIICCCHKQTDCCQSHNQTIYRIPIWIYIIINFLKVLF
jgi:hypothetical protein